MRQTEQKEREHSSQVAPAVRFAVVAQDEGGAIAEQEREEQVELALRKRRHE